MSFANFANQILSLSVLSFDQHLAFQQTFENKLSFAAVNKYVLVTETDFGKNLFICSIF